MTIAELGVGAIEWVVGRTTIVGLWTRADGRRERYEVGPTQELLPKIDALREELRESMAVASGMVPLLTDFADGWGRRFLPPNLEDDSVDVLTLIPHGSTHDLPFHLLSADGEPLGCRIGVTYASSRSLLIRSVSRNPSRRGGRYQGEGAADASQPEARSVMSGGVDVFGSLDERFREICRTTSEAFDGERRLFIDPKRPYSRASVKAAFRVEDKPAVLCIMAHGWVDPQNHRMSGLLVERDSFGLTARAIPLHGGRYFDFRDLPLRRIPYGLATAKDAEVLTAAELEVDAGTECELALLLGCSAGWGRVLQGDEPASLAETFLKIGAASVVAPLWDSHIDAVEAWAAHFLEAWSKRRFPKALAAREAMRKMSDDTRNVAPERLGALSLRGDWL